MLTLGIWGVNALRCVAWAQLVMQL